MNDTIVLPYSHFELITKRLSQFYINNENTLAFLNKHSYKIQLNDYLCVCYGVDGNTFKTRKIEFFRFLGTIHPSNGYWIQAFTLPPDDQIIPDEDVILTETAVFSIQDCNALRQSIFQFQDKTSLFRSTLFFVPEDMKLFRIHCLLQFLTLPVLSSYNHYTVEISQKFLISESKKKQILKRLLDQVTLCEASLDAHGALERKVSKQNH